MNCRDFLEAIVAIPSPSGEERRVTDYITEKLGREKVKAFRDEAGNAIAVFGKGAKTILLAGHIDTVSGSIKVRREGDILHGRGSVDAKGPFAAFLFAALPFLNDERIRIVVAGCVEEEVESSKGAHYLASQTRPDYILIGEPSNTNGITLGYRGRLTVHLRLNKSHQHNSVGENNPLEDFFELFSVLREHGRDRSELGAFQRLTVKPTALSFGDDGLSDRLVATIDCRLPPDENPLELKSLIENTFTGEVSFGSLLKPVITNKNNPLVGAFLRSFRAKGLSPRFKLKAGSSDMNHLAEAFPGVPIVAYGPGDSNLDHTPNERIDLKDLETSISLLQGVFEDLADRG